METSSEVTGKSENQGESEITVKAQVQNTKGEQQNILDENIHKQNPLFIVEILEHIFRSLDEQNLKSCTLVSDLWCREASRALIKTEYIRIPLKFRNSLTSNTKSVEEDERLDEIIMDAKEFLSSRFPPISNIVLNETRDLYMFQKLGILGDSIKRIKLKNGRGSNYPTYSSNWIQKVLDLCPKWIYLNTGEKMEEDEKRERDLRERETTTLAWDEHPMFGLSLIDALEKQQQKQEEEEEKQQKLNVSPILTITDLKLSWNRSKFPKFSPYFHFANSGIQIYNFSFVHNNGTTLCEATAKILLTSKTCMKKLEFEFGTFVPIRCSEILLNKLLIPVIPNLQTLNLFLNTVFLGTVFHPDFKFSTSFPNLKTLNLELLAKAFMPRVNYLQQFFAFTGPASSVKRLCFGPVYPDTNLKTLFEIFNELEELSLRMENKRDNANSSSSVSIKDVCLIGTRLKKLEILNADVIQVGELITGLAEKDLKTLLDLSEEEINKMDLQPMTPSIANLQDLEELTIRFCAGINGKKESRINLILRKLRSKFMPNLKSQETYLFS